MDDGKRARPFSFEDLNLELDEKRRKKFLQDLETFTALNEADGLITSDISFEHEPEGFGGLIDPPEEHGLGISDNAKRSNFGELLAAPEFVTCLDQLISREAELVSHSLFFVRPEGPRAVVHIKNQLATVFSKDGYLKFALKIDLKGPTTLDCVHYAPEPLGRSSLAAPLDGSDAKMGGGLRVFYVSDILQLNGRILTTSELGCRLFFLDSVLDEINCSPKLVFKRVKYEQVNTTRLETVYDRIKAGEFEYETDSILFVNPESHYVGGYNPNWLCYKDPVLRYCAQDEVICKVQSRGGRLYTLDGVPIGEHQDGDPKTVKYPNPSSALRVSIEDIDGASIRFKVVSPVKGARSPDSLRKIYVNFANRGGRAHDGFGRLLQSLRKLNI